MLKKTFFIALLFLNGYAVAKGQLLSATRTGIELSSASIVVDNNDFPLVQKAAMLLQQDIELVTGKKIPVVHTLPASGKNNIIIGSITHSQIIGTLIKNKQISDIAIQQLWEGYQLQTVQGNLILMGSDRRGTAYAVSELSKQIGVSPWYWWADVPVKKRATLYINTSINITDAPKIKYRGLFINDEAPALSNWSREKFGGFNHKFYEKVFELMLRLKSNYLWPAMWGNAFNDDDTLNPVKADEWGIVMGTSHHEPMLRSQQEWKRYGSGKWDYTKNDTVIKAFWQKGMINMGNHESLVTIGMRGDGDEPMTEGTATALLEKIVKDQRHIIENVTGKPAAATPQLWALYKEVQDYYDNGMRVPDDVTLLLCDDNWGHLRKLPALNEKPRKGGYGIYYHFDYVGAPRNYKWVNTNPITKVWEQMHLAWTFNARQVWIVNVGDIKPMEFPLSFFMDYAWNPEKIDAADLQRYTEQWAAAQFGQQYSKDIAKIIAAYTKYNARRKPELLNADTYTLDYKEWETVAADYNHLLEQAENINLRLAPEYRDAYFQLVLHPVKACANLNDMYYHVALNKQAFKNKWGTTNAYAAKVKALYHNDSLISLAYHRLNNGKWNHMMSQTHIGYTYWQQPAQQKMPELLYLPADSVKEKKENKNGAGEEKKITPYRRGNIFREKKAVGMAIQADHFNRAVNTNGIYWKVLPDLGRTGSAVTPFPVTAKAQKPGGNSPHLIYDLYTESQGDITIYTYFSPTLNFHQQQGGLQYAISIDDEAPQIISVNKDDLITYTSVWNKWVAANTITRSSKHKILQPGKHTLKYWMVDAGVVAEKFVIDFGELKQSYLGPPETSSKPGTGN